MIITTKKTLTSSTYLHRNITTWEDGIPSQTYDNKFSASQWLCGKLNGKGQLPTELHGFIIDWDSPAEPRYSDQFCFYKHKTSSGNWRFIVPFKETLTFPERSDYTLSYRTALESLVAKLFISTSKQPYFNQRFPQIDAKCLAPTTFYFYRHSDEPLIKHEGRLAEPHIQCQHSAHMQWPVWPQPGCYSNTDDGRKYKQTRFDEIVRFAKNYEPYLDFEPITSHFNTCHVCLHLNHDNSHHHEILFNKKDTNFLPHIKCFHTGCQERLIKYLSQNIELNEKTQQAKDLRQYSYTQLYLAFLVIAGIFSIDQVLACAWAKTPNFAWKRQVLLKLNWTPGRDADIWRDLFHTNLVWHQKIFYTYDNGVYKEEDETALKAYYGHHIQLYHTYQNIKKLNIDTYSKQVLRSVLTLSREAYAGLIHVDGLNVTNGLLLFNNASYSFQPHSPLYFFKSKMMYDYDPDATCPLWESTLTDMFGSLDCSPYLVLQEFFGYCLTFDRKFQKFLMLYGASGSGKTTILNLLAELIPNRASNMKALLDEKERAFTEGHKAVIVNEEVGSFNSTAIATLKKIASHDKLPVRPMYAPSYDARDVCKLIFSFNEPPKKMKIDDAIHRRMLTINFKKIIGNTKKDDIDRTNKLRAELPGILNWALKGYRRLYQNKAFTSTARDNLELAQQVSPEISEILKCVELAKKENYKWSSKNLYNFYLKNKTPTSFWVDNREFGRIVSRYYEKKRTTHGTVYFLTRPK